MNKLQFRLTTVSPGESDTNYSVFESCQFHSDEGGGSYKKESIQEDSISSIYEPIRNWLRWHTHPGWNIIVGE